MARLQDKLQHTTDPDTRSILSHIICCYHGSRVDSSTKFTSELVEGGLIEQRLVASRYAFVYIRPFWSGEDKVVILRRWGGRISWNQFREQTRQGLNVAKEAVLKLYRHAPWHDLLESNPAAEHLALPFGSHGCDESLGCTVCAAILYQHA